MSERLDDETIRWAARALGGADATARSLRPGGRGPWRIDTASAAGILRVTPPGEGGADEAAMQAYAADHGVPVPRALGLRDDERGVLLLLEVVDGTSTVSRVRDDRALARLGALAACIASVPAPPDAPRRTGPIPGVDWAALRRERPHALLERGAAALAAAAPADDSDVLVHGDFWHGNTLWREGEPVAVLDWDAAGRGPAGIDLATARFDAALFFGAGAEDPVLAGWEAEAGHAAADVAYWDAAAAVASPPDLDWFVPTMIADSGRDDLDRDLLVARRDAFLESALERLGR